ncbi:brain-specific angiogenesis inhibitor 1-associated protein 2 [Athene cunicularia]|uniref:brain-specific angiogenesis inhibitor 1-associated protein 2 n=1 Tax=Athene cunicularia TaxID=194338 RepID=UPI000EF6746C|nr:brain-specific angiogenesis inhibitor 1-associated protein 2 [Athene cunicularia]
MVQVRVVKTCRLRSVIKKVAPNLPKGRARRGPARVKRAESFQLKPLAQARLTPLSEGGTSPVVISQNSGQLVVGLEAAACRLKCPLRTIMEQFNPSLRNFISMGKTYEKALASMTYAAKGYFDALVKMGELASESQGSKELGDVLFQMAEVHRQIQNQLEEMLKSFHNELLTQLEQKVELDSRYLSAALKKYQTEQRSKGDSLDKCQAELKKLRKKSQGSKNPQKYSDKELQAGADASALCAPRPPSLQQGKSSSTGNLLDKDDIAIPPPDYGMASQAFPPQGVNTFKQRPYSVAVPAFSQDYLVPYGCAIKDYSSGLCQPPSAHYKPYARSTAGLDDYGTRSVSSGSGSLVSTV